MCYSVNGDFMYLFVSQKKIIVKECKSFYSRFMGLMFKKDFDYGLRFPKCNSIHSFFMKQNISVIMTDKDNRILYIDPVVKPWSVILPRKDVYYVYEFPVCDLSSFHVGDVLEVFEDEQNSKQVLNV